MQNEPVVKTRRVLTRYSAEDRERLIKEQAQSGQTKKAFCEQHGISVGTFHGWPKRLHKAAPKPTFAEVAVRPGPALEAAVEVLLPNGARIGIRHQGKRDELVALVRGVAGC